MGQNTGGSARSAAITKINMGQSSCGGAFGATAITGMQESSRQEITVNGAKHKTQVDVQEVQPQAQCTFITTAMTGILESNKQETTVNRQKVQEMQATFQCAKIQQAHKLNIHGCHR